MPFNDQVIAGVQPAGNLHPVAFNYPDGNGARLGDAVFFNKYNSDRDIIVNLSIIVSIGGVKIIRSLARTVYFSPNVVFPFKL